MKNKSYIIIGVIIVMALLAYFFFFQNNKNSWMNEILKSDYIVTMKKCDSQKVILPKETVKEIFNKWQNISDNGPWTGENNTCYDTVTISYTKDENNITKEIIIINEDNLVTEIDGMDRYFVGAKEIIDYLNNQYNQNNS